MGNAVAKLIEDLVSGLLSEMLAHIKKRFWIKIKHKRFDRELSQWVRLFVNGNDGTVLTTGDFERYLTQHGPIERIFDAVIGENPLGTKEALFEILIIRFKDIQTKGKTTTYQDEMVLKDLFCGIYQRIDCFYRLQLSDSDRYTIAKIQKAKSEIIDLQKKGNAEIKHELLKIQEVLKEGKRIKVENVCWIYETVGKLLTEGSAEAVHILLPLLNENAGDLHYAVPYLIQLMSNYDVRAKSFVEIQKCIKDEDIYSDIVRKTIYYSLISNNIEILHQVSTRNTDLKSIAENLASNNLGAFFNQIEQNKNGINTINIEIKKNYPNEQWLVLRICAIILSHKLVKNASDVVNELIGSNQAITERIIYFERKSIEIQNENYDNADVAEKLYQEMVSMCTKVDKLPDVLQVKFFAALVRTSILISVEKGRLAIEGIPQKIRSSKEIEMLCMQVKIMNGDSNLEQVLQICMQNDQYWLFNNYLIQFEAEPARMKDIIESHKFILTKDVSVFLIYVQVVSMTEGKEKGKALLESYEKYYSDCLEYWVEKVRLCPRKEALEVLGYIQNKKELYSCSPQTRIVYIRLLYDFECYEEALCAIEHEEMYAVLVVDLVYIKAMALLKTKKEIEALDAFGVLFALGKHDDEIIFYLLILSNKNNREVDERVLQVATKSHSSKVLLCISNYYERHQNLDLAQKLSLGSMFYSDGKLVEVYGNYLRLNNVISKGKSVDCEISDVNTVVHLVSRDAKTEVVYCIYGSEVLPEEPFEWEGGHHIYKDTAIRIGLYRKKVGDTVVLNGISFTISELLTLDCYLFRLSIQKTIDAGEVKCIHMSVDDDGEFDVEAFKKELLENIGEPNDEQQWLSLYKDMSSLPVTIFFAEQFVRVNYLYLALALLRDTDIVMRELAGETAPDNNQFILSFTSIIALHEIGFNLEECSADLTIAASSLKEIDIEAEQIVSEYSRDCVASMGVHNGQLYINESSEEAKQTIMKNAVSVKSFAHKFTIVENNKDLQLEEDPQFDCKDFFGICDYDTIAIAAEQKRTLVTFEAVISAFAGFSGIDVKTVGIADFIATVCNDPNRLVDYVQKMLELRFMFPFTSATIKKISMLYRMLPEQEQCTVSKKWEQALNIPLDDEKYKSIMAGYARSVFLHTYEDVDSSCPIWRVFTMYALQYLGYKLQWHLDAKGRIAIDLVTSDEYA